MVIDMVSRLDLLKEVNNIKNVEKERFLKSLEEIIDEEVRKDFFKRVSCDHTVWTRISIKAMLNDLEYNKPFEIESDINSLCKRYDVYVYYSKDYDVINVKIY